MSQQSFKHNIKHKVAFPKVGHFLEIKMWFLETLTLNYKKFKQWNIYNLIFLSILMVAISTSK